MEKIDFSTLQSKYPLLTSGDISFLNRYFNTPEILQKFQEAKSTKNKNILQNVFRFIIVVILIVFVMFLASKIFFGRLEGGDFSIFLFCAFLVSFFVYMLFKNVLFINENINLKKDILPGFAGSINKDLKYSTGKQYYFGEEAILEYGKLLQKFDRIDFIEDSILFEPVINFSKQNIDTQKQVNQEQIQSNINIDKVETDDLTEEASEEASEEINENKENIPYTIEGYEIQTSEKHKDKNGREYYTVNNHCYIIKVTFNNAKQRFEAGVSLLRDINDNLILKSFRVLGIDFAIIAGYFYLTQPKHGDNVGIKILEGLAESLNVPLGIFCITILIAMYIITYQIYTKLINENRVKTENTQFEKEFDVYSEDQVKSRVVLTPSFMYRIYDFVNKIDKKRVYELYFSDNNMYIKLNFLCSRKTINYLELSSNADIKTNMTQFVNFYIELKNVITLSHSLGLEYFDKGAYENTIIK